LQNELMKIGYCISETEPGVLEWNGAQAKSQNPVCIATYHDHRMAMAFAPVAILYPGLQIEDPEVVSKSYPNFWKELENVGVKITSHYQI